MRHVASRFTTTNFYLASFLFTKELVLLDIDRTDPRRSLFVFEDSPEREDLIHSFNFAKEGSPDVLVDVRKLITAIRQLKERLHAYD